MLRALNEVRRMIRTYYLLWPMTTQVLRSDVVSGSRSGSDTTGRFGAIRGDKLRGLDRVLKYPWTLTQWRVIYAYVFDREITDWKTVREVEDILEELVGPTSMSRPHTPSRSVELIPRSSGPGGDSSGLVY